MSIQKLHYENISGTLVRREGLLSWRCPLCKAEGQSPGVMRTCPECGSKEAALPAHSPRRPSPSINEGVRKVTLGFRWESEAQHHIPTIEIEFEPVSPDSPNDAKGWQDRDRLAAMLTPEAKP